MELSRTTKELDSYLNNFTKEFEKKLTSKKEVKILDAGCGYGLTILGVAKKLNGKVKLVGYNQKKEHGTINSLESKAIKKGIITKDEFSSLKKNISIIHFNINKKFPFKNNSFDFIYSLASIYLYDDKMKFLENCNKILKKGGVARIHLFEIKNSNQTQSKEVLGKPEEYKSYIEIWDEGKLVSFFDYLKKFKGIEIGFGLKENGNKIVYLEMKKQPKLKFNLEFLYAIDSNRLHDKWMGVKSIYKIKN